MHRYYVWAAQESLQMSPIRATGLPSHSHGQCLCGISPSLEVEAMLLPAKARMYLITPPVPFWIAELIYCRVAPLFQQAVAGRFSHALFYMHIARARSKAQAIMRSWHVSYQSTLIYVPEPGDEVRTATGTEWNELWWRDSATIAAVSEALGMRRLTEDELRDALVQYACAPANNLLLVLQRMYLAGVIKQEAAVGIGAWGRPQCRRCGSERINFNWCARCAQECLLCCDCRNLMPVRGCTPLYSLSNPTGQVTNHECISNLPQLQLPFPLSPAQALAAQQVENAIAKGVAELIIWAACGAGKTEVVYQSIRRVVGSNGRVLVVTPRRDVTAELYNRMQQVFGAEFVAGLYGGAEQKYANAPILVATTHQAIRLHGIYALTILDECDAFPYRTEAALQRAIARLVRQGGCFIQMTATPPKPMQKTTAQRQIIYIPARHHGYPLPVPAVLHDPELQHWVNPQAAPQETIQHCPPSLTQCLVQCRRDKVQLLVFVPLRSLVSCVVTALHNVGVKQVAGVHSGSTDRDAVRTSFAAGTLEVVVATTIFERGLTFPYANVAVMLADTPGVFDTATLVQMAGRVGRTTIRPDGNVWFLCRRTTASVQQAINDIAKLNQMAHQNGLLQRTS